MAGIVRERGRKTPGSLVFLDHQWQLSEKHSLIFFQMSRWLKSTLDTAKTKILSPNKIREMDIVPPGRKREKILLREKYLLIKSIGTVGLNKVLNIARKGSCLLC